jgi:hypothetical protein
VYRIICPSLQVTIACRCCGKIALCTKETIMSTTLQTRKFWLAKCANILEADSCSMQPRRITGYVGSRLCERLLASGAQEVRALDVRFSNDGSDDSTQKAKHEGEIIRVVMDITKDCVALRSAFEGADIVFHLASAGMSGCVSYPCPCTGRYILACIYPFMYMCL